ncbi:Hsp33 family molecular chaperone HslO [Myxococcota bacterium]|nr:Hsp33 family molecular chaperone HslO [Myxococcota bacterium]MBU1381492.1 Hsp33 family molecular chaperone HslO [Myxococcota bacterium]MBU1497674.1 Hsp33 family molecular chaperone HslO [Myxococcota bacterium]
MIKTSVSHFNSIEHMKLRAADRIHPFLLENGAIRGAICNNFLMVNEMRDNFELGILETLVLGQAYIAASLLLSSVKGNDRIVLGVECDGPIRGFSVEAIATGEIRGYLKNVPIPVNSPLESFELKDFYGNGTLTITKHLEDAKQPYQGMMSLKHHSLAEDLAEYFAVSEQIPTAISLSVQFDKTGEVSGAGGLFLQALPGTSSNLVGKLEEIVQSIPSPGKAFSTGLKPEAYIQEYLVDFFPSFLDSRRIEFFCRCNHDNMKSWLKILNEKDRNDIATNGPFPLEIRCHNCNSVYHFNREELQELI